MQRSKHRASPGGGGTVSHVTPMFTDDKKRDDSDRVDKLTQQQQQQQQAQQPDGGLVAIENTPTALRRRAQYSRAKPRPIPNSLRTGSDAIAVAAAVDTFYTTPFLQLALREAAEREVAARLRLSVQKMSSKLHTVRVEGLKEATAQLLQWTTQASIESAERQQEQQQQQTKSDARHTDSAAAAAPTGQSNLVLPPYDAVRVEVLGGSSPAVAHGHYPHHQRPPSSELPQRRDNEAAAARCANALRSPSWDVVQHALEGVDYTSSIFNTILVPRLEVRNAMSTGAPISVQLPSDVALQWTTLPTTSRSAAGAASGAASQGTPPPENKLLRAATAVTYEEQELALRYIQGTCLILYHQRRCCAEGCLLYYATEVFQCMRSHIDALFTSQRREREEREGEEQTCQRGKRGLSTNHGSVTGARTPGTSSATTAAAFTAALRESGRSQVSVDPSLVRVVVALVDAVEASCHYNPSSLRRFVQTGGVTAMLNLAYCPFMPTPIRAAVLNTISVLLQQVTPLRRYVAAASKAQGTSSPRGRGGVVEPNPDPLLQRMLENAVHDNPLGRDGQQIPYSTDFGSASKFDSAVRDWFFANGLGNVIASVAQLQDLRNTFQPASFIVPQGAAAATATAVTHANMLREGELHRKRIGWLLECMDGRELR
ncbi:conserved hypothetical protein [Leishmania infantum JPCM5]|uniref:Uncharacterized protein n=2 Tax=Leishmania infantum TaxID=5671 RepID=A4HTY3_LEIIN|nr:conserved hypothetical protein [Leishmania infantum JPCM5]CAC9454111.1 hypothetical_protein_-__conserved [Leishmania infantum]CAM65889.1 conserved hypothetical protein [Leishmania infantum JPCM5]SUZ39516.1 hypothetical_protein_-__conserved [Leishmania infantum]|eukprot:XP_001463524.1 conserved hypothetical protein [Leishmania infantum JPCM5]